MKNSLKLALVLVTLSGCGQLYDVVRNQNSSLVTNGHIEGDLNPPSNNENPLQSPSPSGENPEQSPSPQPPSNQHACDKDGKKVYICHKPKGNPNNAHTICVSINGAIHGHGILMDGSPSSTGDHLGPCQGGGPVIEEARRR